MFAFQLVADALGETLAQGKARWDQARQRLGRRKLQLPPTTKAKAAGARQPTPLLAANDAAKALAMVLKDPLEEFFQKDDKLAWLRTEVRAAGGDPETVDAALTELLAEKARREADAQSLVLPGLQTGSVQMPLRTTREGEEVLGSVLDYLRWLGLSNAADEWSHWMREEFRAFADSTTARNFHVEKIFPGQCTPTPFTNFAGFRLLTKLCLRKSKIAQGLYDQALTVLGRVSVGDQTLHETLDANAASSSGEARAFVLGPQERPPRPAKSTPVDLEAVIRTCVEDDDVTPQVAERRLAKVALVRQLRESSQEQREIAKRQKVADIEKYEEETRAEKEANIEKLHAERDRAQAERARIQAERQQMQEDAEALREQRARQHVHDSEVAAEERRADIRDRAAKGRISQEAAADMLGESRQTPIVRFEKWIGTHCECKTPSRCSSVLAKMFKVEVEAGRHAKPRTHKNEAGAWNLYVEHDGPLLQRLHQQLHDKRKGVDENQARLTFSGSSQRDAA
jgi:hypothetical protein